MKTINLNYSKYLIKNRPRQLNNIQFFIKFKNIFLNILHQVFYYFVFMQLLQNYCDKIK